MSFRYFSWFWFCWSPIGRWAICSAVFVPIVLFPVRTLGRKIRKSVESSQSRLGELTQILQETFAGNRVVKAFGMERFEIGRFHEAARRLVRENMRWIRAQMITPPLMDILSAFVVIPILLYARNEINHGAMTVGVFLHLHNCFIQGVRADKGPGQRLSTIRAGAWRHSQSFQLPAIAGRGAAAHRSATSTAVFAPGGIRKCELRL